MDTRSKSVAGSNVGQLQATQDSTMKRSLHDLDAFMTKKQTTSSPFFRTARVQTCSHVMMKNGTAIAVAFPLEKTGWKHPNSYNNTKRSSEVDSWSRTVYQQRGYNHAGMLHKPLEPYHPTSFRSRLPQPTVVMPYKNSSQIVIGDRSSDDKRQFKTVNKLQQLRPNLENACTNGGILAAQTKWIHYQ